jgi:hypothetical protein
MAFYAFVLVFVAMATMPGLPLGDFSILVFGFSILYALTWLALTLKWSLIDWALWRSRGRQNR